jgi:leader peptidase (prepilin peptidase) / N-methyltransferase
MSFSAALTLIFLVFAVPLSLIDIRTMHIPAWITYAGCAAILVYTVVCRRSYIVPGLTGAAVIFLLFLLLRELTHKGLGFGDVRYSLLCGLYCGFPGILAGCVLAALSGLVYFGLFHIIKRNVPIKTVKLPFAPFMTAGTVTAALAAAKYF